MVVARTGHTAAKAKRGDPIIAVEESQMRWGAMAMNSSTTLQPGSPGSESADSKIGKQACAHVTVGANISRPFDSASSLVRRMAVRVGRQRRLPFRFHVGRERVRGCRWRSAAP